MVPRGNRRVGYPSRRWYYPTDVMAAGAAVAYQGVKNAYGKYRSQAAINSLPRTARGVVKARKVRYRKAYKKAVAKKITRRNPAIQDLSRRVRNLAMSNSSDKGELIYRNINSGRVLSGVSTIGAAEFGQGITLCETVMDQLQWFNPATNAFVTADASGAKYKKVHFARAYYSLDMRNNYQVPCKVTVYTCIPKVDTGNLPSVCLSNWATDNLLNGAVTDPSVYLTDSAEFNDTWTIHKTTKKTLQPGQEMFVSYSAKPFDYDSAFIDSHSDSYQKAFGSMAFYIRVEGPLGHDTAVTTEQSTLISGIDYVTNRSYKVIYDAGVKCKFVYSSNNLDTSFTNAGVVSLKPVADNIGYSLS